MQNDETHPHCPYWLLGLLTFVPPFSFLPLFSSLISDANQFDEARESSSRPVFGRGTGEMEGGRRGACGSGPGPLNQQRHFPPSVPCHPFLAPRVLLHVRIGDESAQNLLIRVRDPFLLHLSPRTFFLLSIPVSSFEQSPSAK